MTITTPITSGVKAGLKGWRPIGSYVDCDRCGLPVRAARVIRAGEPVVCPHCLTNAELRELHARKDAA